MNRRQQFDSILALVGRLSEPLGRARDMLLGNLVMFGEIPAPTSGERRRIEFLMQRFTECGLQSCSIDHYGNGLALLPGSGGREALLVSAHADTPFSANVRHTVSVASGSVTGPGVADNSLGLAVIATLPTMLEMLDIRLSSDLLLMGAVESLGRGDLRGLRSFLASNRIPIKAGVSVEGAQLGRLDYRSLASLAGEITFKVDGDIAPGDDIKSGPIRALCELIERLRSRMEKQFAGSTLVLGSIEAGTSFKTPARSATLRFQVLGKSNKTLSKIEAVIEKTIEKVVGGTATTGRLEAIARTESGGLTAKHPLVSRSSQVMKTLGVKPRKARYSSTVSSFIERNVPSVTIGISEAKYLNQCDETVFIDPMLRGMAQLIGILLAIDGGCCEGH